MWQASPLIDSDLLIATLLERDKPAGFEVLADLDVDSIEEVPLSTFRVALSGQDLNGPGLWNASLVLNSYVESGTGFAGCCAWYAAIHAWDMPGTAVLEGIGSVEQVGDASVFSRTAAAIPMIGKFVDQYVGIFNLLLRSA